MKKGTKFQHKRPDEPQVCAICGFPLKTYNALGKHVAKYHSNVCTMKEYVDKYVEPFAHKCPYCDNERNFVHGRYKETCSDKACIQKHREATNLGKYGNKCSLKGSNEQKVVDAIIEKYGVDNVFKLDSMQQVAKQRMKEKYGKEYSSQVPEIRQKVEDTCMRKYGYKTNLLNPDQIEQIKRTCLEKYGNEYVCASKYTLDKQKQHCLDKFGVEYYMQTDEFKDKSTKTMIETYGVANIMQVPLFYEQAKQSLYKHYGVRYTMLSPVLRERSRQTMLARYGVESVSQMEGYIKPHIYKKDLDGYFSKSEHAFADILDNHNITYVYNWYHNKKHWDFAIYKNNQLDTVIEIDGEYHHGYRSDWHSVKLDVGRFMMLGSNIKYLCGDSQRLNDIFDELCHIMNMTYEEWIQMIINRVPLDFPYPNYTVTRLKYDYMSLCNDTRRKTPHKMSQYGMSSVYMYNKSLYTENYNGTQSLVELWSNHDKVAQCVRERSLYYSDVSSALPIFGMIVSNICPMRIVISTGTYLYILTQYLAGIDNVVEICPTTGSLLLATNASNKKYTCKNIQPSILAENNKIAELHNLPLITDDCDASIPDNACVLYDMTTNDKTLDTVINTYKSTHYIVISYDDKLSDSFPELSLIDSFRSNYGALVDTKYMYMINYT